MIRALQKITVFFLLAFILSACASRDWKITPESTLTPVASRSHPQITVASVQDNRVFRQTASGKEGPSFDGYLRGASKEQLSNVVGRAYFNLNDESLWNIILDEERTVQQVVRDLIESSTLVDGMSSRLRPVEVLVLHIDIQEYWGWVEIGSGTVRAEVRAQVTIEDAQGNLVIDVYGHGEEKSMLKNMKTLLARAFGKAHTSFMSSLDSQLHPVPK